MTEPGLILCMCVARRGCPPLKEARQTLAGKNIHTHTQRERKAYGGSCPARAMIVRAWIMNLASPRGRASLDEKDERIVGWGEKKKKEVTKINKIKETSCRAAPSPVNHSCKFNSWLLVSSLKSLFLAPLRSASVLFALKWHLLSLAFVIPAHFWTRFPGVPHRHRKETFRALRGGTKKKMHILTHLD